MKIVGHKVIAKRAIQLIHENGEKTTWPWPFNDEYQSPAWKARYAPETLTKEDAMALAEIADAYSTMISHPHRGLRDASFALHRAYVAEFE